MIITIGRECGCNADEIGRMLAGKYGIFCYTKVELIQLAKEKGVYEKYPFFFGEMPVDMMISPMAESLEVRLRNTPQAVSYTHLDVYKRQGHSSVIQEGETKAAGTAGSGCHPGGARR